MEGECGCGAATYRLTAKPMFVHCCHCSDCQKQSGSAYVLNALIESDRVEVKGETTDHLLPTPSGNGQRVTRCKECGVALFSAYLIREGKVRYIRVGTLKDPSDCPPDVQIFVSSKQSWVPLHPEIPSFEEFYSFKEVWPADSLARLKAAFQ